MQTSVYKNGEKEPELFNTDKLKKTIYSACLNVRAPQDSANSTTEMVCNEIENWLSNKQEVTSLDIKDKATEFLEKYHPEAAYIYNQYSITI